MTRRAATVVAVAGLAAAGLAACAAPGRTTPMLPADLRTRTSGEDWPAFLGPRGNGSSSETGILTDWPHGGPPLRWQFEAGEGYAVPAVARGRLFFFDRVGSFARLTCLRAETGEQLWQESYATTYADDYGFSNGPRAAPVVDGARVYTFGVEGRLRCSEVVSGRLLWDVDTTRDFGVPKNFFGAGGNPVVEGDLLIVPVGGSPPGSALVAFASRTGEVRYQAGDDLSSYSTPVIAVVGGRRLGFHLARAGLLLFEPQSGRVLDTFPWRARTAESVNAASPLVAGGKVFITEAYGPGSALLEVNNDRLRLLRQDESPRQQSMSCHFATPVVAGGVLYGSSGKSGGDSELRAVELESGRILWRQPALGRASLIQVDGHLLVLTERGRLLLVRATPESYQLVAEATPAVAGAPLLEFPSWGAPVMAQGLVFLRGKSRLVALDLMATASPSAPVL